MQNEVFSVAEAAAHIAAGDVMVLAGAEPLLAQLPPGRWIGGTTVHFVTDAGGAEMQAKLFCTTFPQATGAAPSGHGRPVEDRQRLCAEWLHHDHAARVFRFPRRLCGGRGHPSGAVRPAAVGLGHRRACERHRQARAQGL